MNIFQKVTLKNLKENRTRTLVTIIGIILSAAMFTAVTVSISSLRNYLISHSIYKTGGWYGAAYSLSKEEVNSLSEEKEVSNAVIMNQVGFAELTDFQNLSKPYLCVYGINQDFNELMPVHLTQGRMPENSSEILLPEHLATNGGINYNLNDTLSLNLGTRTDSYGDPLNNHTAYSPEDSEPGTEKIENTSTHTYTVTGFYERPSFESYIAPGYTALTISDTPSDGTYDMYLCTKNGKDISSFMKKHITYPNSSWELNYDLLRLYGYSGESSYNSVLYSLATILVGIIMFGSISLIYNAFSISVSERTKQFGLLASIGATKHQLIQSVLFESFFLSIIGIPLGIISGILGIGITFHFTGDIIAEFLYSDGGPTLTMHFSLLALLIATAISLVTILISAYLPARRAMKCSAIEAIRQSKDIAIHPRKIKTSRLISKLFGFEGVLAAKNYKRNGKKYRATVISLFLSIVLFISASSLCAYLTKSVNTVISDQGYDISYSFSPDDYQLETLMTELSDVSGVTFSSYTSSFHFSGSVNTSALSKEYRDYLQDNMGGNQPDSPKTERTFTNFSMVFVKDEVFKDYISSQNLSESDFFHPKHPKPVLLNNINYYNPRDSKYYNFSLLTKPQNSDAVIYISEEKEGYINYGLAFDSNGNALYNYTNEENPDESLNLTPEEACFILPVDTNTVLSEPPNSTNYYSSTFILYYPYSMMDTVFTGLKEDTSYQNITNQRPISKYSYTTLMFRCEDHTQAAADMRKILSEHNLPVDRLIDYAISMDQERAMIAVINIFSYGFIILISLIAAANVFNTISTNIILRKREFAMLKSIGLTPEGFQKMMNFECLLYGIKGLLYGLPVSFLITWLIHRSISNGLEMNFFIPWYSIAIAIGSVFLVVFATMLYSMHKIEKENIMDVLKDETI